MTFCACMGQAVRAGPRPWPGLCCYPALASGSSAQAGKRRSAPGAVVFGSPSAVIRGLIREAYALDLRQFTRWCRSRSLALFAVRRADIESFARVLEAIGRARATVTQIGRAHV